MLVPRRVGGAPRRPPSSTASEWPQNRKQTNSRRIMTGRDVVDAVVRLGFDRQAAPLEAFLATCVEKRRGENKVKRAKRAKVVAAQAAAAATEEPAAPAQPPLGPALLGPQPI